MPGILGSQLTYINTDFLADFSQDRSEYLLNVLPNIYNAKGSLAVSLIVGVVSTEVQPGRIVTI